MEFYFSNDSDLTSMSQMSSTSVQIQNKNVPVLFNSEQFMRMRWAQEKS